MWAVCEMMHEHIPLPHGEQNFVDRKVANLSNTHAHTHTNTRESRVKSMRLRALQARLIAHQTTSRISKI